MADGYPSGDGRLLGEWSAPLYELLLDIALVLAVSLASGIVP